MTGARRADKACAKALAQAPAEPMPDVAPPVREPAASSDCLIDKFDSENNQEKSGQKRRLRRRNSDEAVAKRLRDNFPGWSQEQTHLRLVDGVSLWERVKTDMKKQGKDKVTMGRGYYDTRREEYMGADAPQRLLVPKDESEPIDQRLLEALTAMMKHRRSYQEMHDWLQAVESVNQKCFVALCRQIMKLSPAANVEACNLIVDVMRMVVRLKLEQKFKDELVHTRLQFDKACLRTIDMFKKNDQGTTTWWRANRSWASLVLPADEVDKIVKEENDFARVEPELAKVCETECGRRLFGRALASLDSNRVTKKVLEVVKTLEGTALTMETLDENRKAFMRKMKTAGVDPSKNIAKKRSRCPTEASR